MKRTEVGDLRPVVLCLINLISVVAFLAACQPTPRDIPVAIATATPDEPTVVSTRTPQSTPTVGEAPTDVPTPVPTFVAPPRDIPYHTLEIALNYAGRRIDVAHGVAVVNKTADSWDEVVFAVPPAHRAGVFRLHDVHVVTSEGRLRAAFDIDSTMLHIVLPVPVRSAGALRIDLRYTMHVPVIELTTWLPEGNMGAGERVLQAGDWHPTLVPYRENEGWQAWPYHSVGDPTVYPIADYDVTVIADPTIVVAAPGQADVTGDKRRYKLRGVRSFAFLASPDYRIMEASVKGLEVHSYYLPSDAEPAEAALDAAVRALELYSERYGPYPYPELGLTIAQNAYYGAMEYSGLVSLSGYMYQMYDEPMLPSLSFLTAHEVAHQWWYGAVGNDQVYEPWLDESFAKYSELLYAERYNPELTQWWWENNVYRYNLDGDLNRSIYDFATTQAYIRQIYGLGARFLGDLRATLGDEVFFDFVRTHRRYGEGTLVTGDDFFAVLDASTDKDLKPLIRRYFSQSEE